MFALGLPLAAATRAEVRTKTIAYTHDGVTLEGVLAWDDGVKGKRPGVLVVHEWWGHNGYARERAGKLAALGYVAFALDMYGKGKTAATPEEAQRLATPFYQDRALMRARAAAGLEVLRTQENVDASRLAAIGYCFGGTVCLELARSGADLRAVVSFHGGLSNPTPADAGKIRAKVLVCNGADDPMVPAEERRGFKEEMSKAGVDYQFIDYGGAVHAFTNPGADAFKIPGVAYNEKADRRSWGAMRAFFDETLGAK
ncbi:MAG: dienelactone hydrolase family protein [Phycisphaerae bacterium]|nr:dienelactone hydrolase family protein [Phycisphaerae bacterium]